MKDKNKKKTQFASVRFTRHFFFSIIFFVKTQTFFPQPSVGSKESEVIH